MHQLMDDQVVGDEGWRLDEPPIKGNRSANRAGTPASFLIPDGHVADSQVIFARQFKCHLPVRHVAVRDQKTRWGSCSIRGTITLNWRLIQAPPFIADYLIVHELMHLREMNHSPRYWGHVAQAFPEYRLAERWLKENSRGLMP